MNFMEKMQLRMARTGKSFHRLCREMGAAGGKQAAFNKLKSKQALARNTELFHGEQRRQVARGLVERDAVPDEIFSPQDRMNIGREQALRQTRLMRMASVLTVMLLTWPVACTPLPAVGTVSDRGLAGNKICDGRLAATNRKRAETNALYSKPSRVGSNPAPSVFEGKK